MTRRPLSTYRLQVSGSFTLLDAADTVQYLAELGIDWVYLSPLLTATAGSEHGYDVVDPTGVDPARGGSDGLAAVSARAREAGMGTLADIVPNHMGVGVPRENPWWWDVLRHGRDSRWAEAFDIDWDAGGGRLLIPVLGEPIDEGIASGALRIEGDELRYHDRAYPLAAGSESAGLPEALDRQHFELVHWRRADSDLNYRRFFAVSDLAAVRVELPEVFDATHVEILRWIREGLVDGLRVDHPDGLADPGAYLERLAAETGDAYVLVEKILEPGESLPPHWPTAGTTGYDALAEIDRVLIDPRGNAMLTELDATLRRDGGTWADLIHDTKRGIADGILQAEVRRLVRDLLAEDPGAGDPAVLGDVLAELLACFPVYRSYLPNGLAHLAMAVTDAARRRPEIAAEIRAVGERLRDPGRSVARRFQQTSGMVMAKGVEDTAFYRVSRLASLTEVGGDPDEFSIGVAEFHVRQQSRLASFPDSMTTLTTHDTKRGEDTRARISAIAEVPADWVSFVERRRANANLGDGAFENLLWESIAGSWPREREVLHAYAEKAAREAGTSTTWQQPDEAFETAMHQLVDAIFDDRDVLDDLEGIVALLRPAGYSNALAAKLLQLTGPGVPDVYQGSELWERSLVDPDNRRAVDFDERRALLARLDAGDLPAIGEDGAVKLLVTSRALRLRRDRSELFDRYLPLEGTGPAADHVVAIDRGGAIPVATRLPIGLALAGGWRDTLLHVSPGDYVDVLTGSAHRGGALAVGRVLERYPVALLAKVAS